ncbi:hypothetical protein EYF80_050171 [Liparis tanakae]|uniref:Uncharacterized protein n=1 Tax=Liparis tanakae TaxID=230148 RepID=A0A4Z2FEU4_9TELE|nr:hypothetical protein EYF80_050171 [Liparis tanakae]
MNGAGFKTSPRSPRAAEPRPAGAFQVLRIWSFQRGRSLAAAAGSPRLKGAATRFRHKRASFKGMNRSLKINSEPKRIDF